MSRTLDITTHKTIQRIPAHKVEHVPEHAHVHPKKPTGTRGFASGATAEAVAAEARPSALAIAKDLIKTEGIRGVYRGFFATCARDVPFSAIYFPFFAHLNALVSISEHYLKINGKRLIRDGR